MIQTMDQLILRYNEVCAQLQQEITKRQESDDYAIALAEAHEKSKKALKDYYENEIDEYVEYAYEIKEEHERDLYNKEDYWSNKYEQDIAMLRQHHKNQMALCQEEKTELQAMVNRYKEKNRVLAEKLMEYQSYEDFEKSLSKTSPRRTSTPARR